MGQDLFEKASKLAEEVKENVIPKIKNDYLPKVKKGIGYAADKASDAVEKAADKASVMVSDAMVKAAKNPKFAVSDITRDEFMLTGRFARCGYDWWWHSFTGHDSETGEEKAFFVEYFMCNPALQEEEPVFGQLPENREQNKYPSYVMVKCGAWGENATQLHRFFAWKDVSVKAEAPFVISASDCFCSEGRIAGSVSVSAEERDAHPEWMCDAGSMKWSLAVDKKIPYNVGYGASKPLRAAEAFEMYWHAEGMKTEYAGTVEYNGREYLVTPDTSYGYADKNWGSDFTSPWVWLSSNNLVSKKTGEKLNDSVFDIGGGRPCVLGFEFNDTLLGAMYYEGTEIEFNFSKAHMNPKTKFYCTENDDEVIWHVEQKNSAYVMVTDIKCLKKDMLLINYEAPDGAKLHNRLWNGGNGAGTIKLYSRIGDTKELIDEIEVKNCGCEWGEFENINE